MGKLIKLFSDNHEGTLMSQSQYREETLSMSTGDFHTHKTETVYVASKSRLATIAKHAKSASLKSKVWKKSEISAVAKLINSKNFHKNENCPEILQGIESVESLFSYGYMEERKITREQSRYGIEYLLKRYFKKNGEPRKGSPFGSRENVILKSFSKFRFVGFYEMSSNGGYWTTSIPVYRVYSKDGSYFDYAPIHWGVPIVLN